VTDPVLVLRKLAMLREHVSRARRRRPDSADVFEADIDRQDALAMSLLVAAQEAADIALHIATDEAWGVPGSYGDGFALLVRHGAIDPRLADELTRIIGVRHRIAHGYAGVDLKRLWAELPAGLDALDRYAAAIARFIGPLNR
jgi:uncharacterized protein YutE (UPF0331/DUF86 family)